MEWIQLLLWVGALGAALFVLIRGADMFIDAARDCGQALGMSTFAIGVFIVGFGTSLPELASSLAAALQGTTELVVATVVGSNMTNILLIIGVMAVLAGRVVIQQELLKTELPLFVISQCLLVAVVIDGVVDRIEAVFLLVLFAAYVWYVLVEAKNGDGEADAAKLPKLQLMTMVMMALGLAAVLIGAKYTVTMVVNIATALAVPVGLVSITAVAIGTSLPELFVTLRAIRAQHTELAMGNIFGSNTFNALVVVGIPGLLIPLTVDSVVMQLGLWYMIAASFMIFVVGLSRQVMRWEGLMMLIFFTFFLFKLSVFM